MEELKRGQIKRIIEESMRLATEIGLRDTIDLQDVYKLAEAVKGGKLTKKEKQSIAMRIRHSYPVHREKKKETILIIT